MNVRPFVDDDAPAVAALISANEELFYGRPGRITGADVLFFQQYNKEAWVWEEDGRIVAGAMYGVHGDAANIRGFVADKGRGIGTETVERGEAFARAQGVQKILAGAAEPDAAARALFEAHGYREVRRFYEMAIELTEEPWFRSFRPGLSWTRCTRTTYEAFYDALNEAFDDHWEWHPQPVRRVARAPAGPAPRRRPPRLVRRPRRRRARRRHAQRGASPAAVTSARSASGPPWRGKGLAKALLLRTFAEFCVAA